MYFRLAYMLACIKQCHMTCMNGAVMKLFFSVPEVGSIVNVYYLPPHLLLYSVTKLGLQAEGKTCSS